MVKFRSWWLNELSIEVKFVFLILLANGLPAFLILMSLPRMTEILFVWTIKPVINARFVGVMYSNALLLVAFGAFQKSWPRVRITMVVITLFSIFATLLTFFYLKPFLAHPWYHLAYWLTMYFILFFAAPYVFIKQEQKYGGRLPVEMPLTLLTKGIISFSMGISAICGLGLIFQIETVNTFWPWEIPPLVGGLIGILFITHTAAYGWALWDGDWVRIRPIIWQAPLTGVLFILLPLLHSSDLNPNSGNQQLLYHGIALFFVLAHLGIILSQRMKG